MYRVGPLARLNLADQDFHAAGQRRVARMASARRRRPRHSSFYYHWARLIEILYALERIEQLLDDPRHLQHGHHGHREAGQRAGRGRDRSAARHAVPSLLGGRQRAHREGQSHRRHRAQQPGDEPRRESPSHKNTSKATSCRKACSTASKPPSAATTRACVLDPRRRPDADARPAHRPGWNGVERSCPRLIFVSAETRAPCWQIRCIKCGFTEPWGKYGVQRWANGKSFTIGKCFQCKRIRCHVVEKVPASKPKNERWVEKC